LGLGYASLAKQRSSEAAKQRSSEAAKQRSSEAAKQRSSEAALLGIQGLAQRAGLVSLAWQSDAKRRKATQSDAKRRKATQSDAKRRKATQSERRFLTRLGEPPSVLLPKARGRLSVVFLLIFLKFLNPPCLAKALSGQLCERMRDANQSCYSPSITLAFDP